MTQMRHGRMDKITRAWPQPPLPGMCCTQIARYENWAASCCMLHDILMVLFAINGGSYTPGCWQAEPKPGVDACSL